LHKSAHEIGSKFIKTYWNEEMKSILEIGSLDVNGTLRDFRPENSNWVGVDLEYGKGVDVVIENSSALPFSDKSFDLVVASSIFEHDSQFWTTFIELLRVTKDSGYVYINAPSNGGVHRYPVDAFRFYPDAGKSMEKWGRTSRSKLRLEESFIAEQDQDIWNDFVAIFSFNETLHPRKIYLDIPSTNIWLGDEFLDYSQSDSTQDMRNLWEVSQRVNKVEQLLASNEKKLEEFAEKQESLLSEKIRFEELYLAETISKKSLLSENYKISADLNKLSADFENLRQSRSYKLFVYLSRARRLFLTK
jgi:SAM-dependent methyltransferase